MSEAPLRLAFLHPGSADIRAMQIVKGLTDLGYRVSMGSLHGDSQEDWQPHAAESDAVIVALTSNAHGKEYRTREFEQVARHAGEKTLVLMLDEAIVPSPIHTAPSYPYFENPSTDESTIQRFAFWIRDAVQARQDVENAMPDESLKTTEEPQEVDQTAETKTTSEPADDDEESTVDPLPAARRWMVYVAIASLGLAVALLLLGNYLNRTIPDIVDGILYEEGAMEFKLVRPAPFLMGSDDADERPQHNVDLTDPLLVGTQEVTNKLYQDYLAATEARYGPPDPFVDDSRSTWPVVNVAFNDVVDFARWYSQTTGATYRLPTEAEWEWLARQSEDALSDPCTYINFRGGSGMSNLAPSTNNLIDEEVGSEFNCGSESPVLVEVDAFDFDAFGLYHLFGNAAEWVQDCYSPNYLYATDDGSASESGDCENRVYRGGSWLSRMSTITPTFRSYAPPDYRDFDIGFRLVRDLGWLDVYALDRPGTDWNNTLSVARYTSYAAAAVLFVAFGWLVRRRRAGMQTSEAQVDDESEVPDEETRPEAE